MKKFVLISMTAGLLLSLSSIAGAALSVIGFSEGEGYESGIIAGQPETDVNPWHVEGDSSQIRVARLSDLAAMAYF